jgi:hypothetical protein
MMTYTLADSNIFVDIYNSRECYLDFKYEKVASMSPLSLITQFLLLCAPGETRTST